MKPQADDEQASDETPLAEGLAEGSAEVVAEEASDAVEADEPIVVAEHVNAEVEEVGQEAVSQEAVAEEVPTLSDKAEVRRQKLRQILRQKSWLSQRNQVSSSVFQKLSLSKVSYSFRLALDCQGF